MKSKPTTIQEHYALIRKMFEDRGIRVLAVIHETNENDSPETAFVVTIKRNGDRMKQIQTAAQVMTNYAYRIEWA